MAQYTSTATVSRTLRPTDGTGLVDTLTGLVLGSLLGAFTGYLWAIFNPIQLAPFIHLRIFAFLIPVFGLVLGRGTGFISGYVASIVWALTSGLFVPLHTPLADGILVGLTGWLPAMLLAGDKSRRELLASMSGSRFWGFYLKSAVVLLGTGLIMALGVAASLQLTAGIPFWTGFWLIGVVSDTGPMIVGTAPAAYLFLTLIKSLSWIQRW